MILAHESQKHSSGKVLNSLKKDGVKVVYVKDAQSINETYDTFKSIGKLTGREKQAKDLVDETKNKLIKSLILFQIIIKSKVYLWRYHLNQIFILQVGTIFNDMLNKLDAKNSFSDISGWKSVSKRKY